MIKLVIKGKYLKKIRRLLASYSLKKEIALLNNLRHKRRRHYEKTYCFNVTLF